MEFIPRTLQEGLTEDQPIERLVENSLKISLDHFSVRLILGLPSGQVVHIS